jgi:hypothetical protein
MSLFLSSGFSYVTLHYPKTTSNYDKGNSVKLYALAPPLVAALQPLFRV